MKKRYQILNCSLFVALIACASPAYCDDSLSNAQKLEKVHEMYTDYKNDFPDVKDISPLEAMERNKGEQVIFVDTRNWYERRVSMLPGAVTERKFLKNISKYRGRTIIAYCTIGYRSAEFAEDMGEKGISVYNLKGGILEWVLEGGKVYNKKGETRRIHVYEKEWDYAPDGYISKMKLPGGRRIGKVPVFRHFKK